MPNEGVLADRQHGHEHNHAPFDVGLSAASALLSSNDADKYENHSTLLTSHCVKVRDFAYESGLPPVPKILRVTVKKQPAVSTLRPTRDTYGDNEHIDQEDPSIPRTWYIDSSSTGVSHRSRYRSRRHILTPTPPVTPPKLHNQDSSGSLSMLENSFLVDSSSAELEAAQISLENDVARQRLDSITGLDVHLPHPVARAFSTESVHSPGRLSKHIPLFITPAPPPSPVRSVPLRLNPALQPPIHQPPFAIPKTHVKRPSFMAPGDEDVHGEDAAPSPYKRQKF